MGEGVDPTQMCRSLVDKVVQSEQLRAIADPDLLVLFEDWLEELETEVQALIKTHGPMDSRKLADKLGLSVSGATFLLSKLARAGTI
jgi:predicted transcriptional regulator